MIPPEPQGGEWRGLLGEVCRRYELRAEQEGLLEALAMAVVDDWADPRAPTTIRDPVGVVRDHIADSLVALELAELEAAASIVDIGSGAGFPGLALAVALPECEVRLLESLGRKCEFLEATIERIGLGNVTVARARAEEWWEGVERNDVAIARAVGPQPVVLEYAAPLLRQGGNLVDWRGRRDPEQERAAEEAAVELGMAVGEIRHVAPFEGARDRHLHLYQKVYPTPGRFPRRAGMARKRPLGGRREGGSAM